MLWSTQRSMESTETGGGDVFCQWLLGWLLVKANPRFMLEVCRASCHVCAGDEGWQRRF